MPDKIFISHNSPMGNTGRNIHITSLCRVTQGNPAVLPWIASHYISVEYGEDQRIKSTISSTEDG